MSQLLDLIHPDEFPALIVLICLLFVTAERLARPDSLTMRRASWLSAAVCLAYIVTGAAVWSPARVAEFLMLLIRAGLAAAVTFGVATLLLSLIAAVAGAPVEAMITWSRRKAAEAQRRSSEKASRREALAKEHQEREHQARLQPVLERERQHRLEEEAKRERERFAKTDEARAEVIRFYEEHAALLEETFPHSLFGANLQTKFPPSIAPAEAWIAAQEMISGMLPKIAEARDKERSVLDETKKREDDASKVEQTKRETEERRHAPTRLTEWYERERSTIEGRLPDGMQRDMVLQELQDRYDQLIREAIQEAQP